MLTKAIIESINDSVLCWLATVDRHGEPNVSPKEMFVADGENSLLIANIASPNSVNNIKINASVCVSFVDIFKQKGFKIKGEASLIESSDVDFSAKEAKLRVLGGEQFPILSIISIKVKSVVPIIAPSYWLFPETTESMQINSAMKRYGVKSCD